MFTFKSLATLAATMAVMASAVPTAAPGDAPVVPGSVVVPMDLPAGITTAELAAMALGTNVLACTDTKWNGACWSGFVDHSNCRNAPNGMNDKFSSIKQGNKSQYRCYWYEHAGCLGRAYTNQDDDNLSDGDGFFNDRISSIKCWILSDGKPLEF